MASAPVCPSSPHTSCRPSGPADHGWAFLLAVFSCTCSFNDLPTYPVLEPVLGLCSNELPPPKHLCFSTVLSPSVIVSQNPSPVPTLQSHDLSIRRAQNFLPYPTCQPISLSFLSPHSHMLPFNYLRVLNTLAYLESAYTARCQACLLTLYHPL